MTTTPVSGADFFTPHGPETRTGPVLYPLCTIAPDTGFGLPTGPEYMRNESHMLLDASMYDMPSGAESAVEAVWPQFAVSWRDVSESFCALVRENGPKKLRVHLYDFEEEPRQITADLWELAPGTYEAQLRDESGASAWQQDFTVPPRATPRSPTQLQFPLPARQLMVLEITPRP